MVGSSLSPSDDPLLVSEIALPSQQEVGAFRKPKGILRVTFVDLGLMILCILLIAAALGGGLGGFFSIQNKETVNAYNDLADTVKLQQLNIQRILTGMVRQIKTLAAYYDTVPNAEYYTQAVPFVTDADYFVEGILIAGRALPVSDSDKAAFIASVRARGPDFANYTFTTRDAANNIIPAPQAPMYYVYDQTYPGAFSMQGLGYDIGTSAVRFEGLQKAIRTRMPTSTNRLYALTNGVLTPAALLYQCYFNGTDLEGIAFISMTFDAMMPGALSSISNLFKFVYVSAFDVTNGTTTFLYTTATQQQLTDEGVNASPQNATSEQMIGFHMKQALHMTTTAVYADRNWTIHFSANNAFIAEFGMAEKWIALFITLLLVVVLAFFVVVFAKSIQISTFLRKVTRERLVLVEENQNNLKRLLLRVESEEKKTRSTVNAIPDAIMVLNTIGTILRTNTSFDRIFGVEGKRNSKNGDITDILPDMDPMFFKTANIIDAIDTNARSALGIMIPVQVTVAPITSDESDSEHLVLIKNMSDREKLVQELKRQEESAQAMMKFVTLDAQMRVESFRKQLIDYCRKEHNAESVYFLQDMLYYRNSDIDTRVKMQNEIFEKYIRNGAPMQLNITTELVKQVQTKLDNAIGNIDLFAPIEAAVKSLFMIDIYPRFVKQGEMLQ